MRTKHPTAFPVLAALALGAAAQVTDPTISAPAGTVAATASGTLAPALSAAPVLSSSTGSALDRAEAVVFGGQAAITGRVIRDAVFGAPPVLEVIVDLSGVTATGQRTGRKYAVQGQAIVHRPLQAFEQLEVGFSFAPVGDVLQARSGLATFPVYFSAARGITTGPVRILPHPRS